MAHSSFICESIGGKRISVISGFNLVSVQWFAQKRNLRVSWKLMSIIRIKGAFWLNLWINGVNWDWKKGRKRCKQLIQLVRWRVQLGAPCLGGELSGLCRSTNQSPLNFNFQLTFKSNILQFSIIFHILPKQLPNISKSSKNSQRFT